jgi:rubrerythrin
VLSEDFIELHKQVSKNWAWFRDPSFPRPEVQEVTVEKEPFVGLEPISKLMVTESHTDRERVRTAIIAEYDAINLYEQFANATKNSSVRKMMLDIAREEKVHVGEFELLLEKLDKEMSEAIEDGAAEAAELVKGCDKKDKGYPSTRNPFIEPTFDVPSEPMLVENEEKKPKEEVRYEAESKKKSEKYGTTERCMTCAFFVKTEGPDEPTKKDGGCSKVEGVIDPRGWCTLYKAGWGPARDKSTGQVRKGGEEVSEVVENEKANRSSFDAKKGDVGRCVIDEHVLGLDVEKNKEFEDVKTYEGFVSARKRLTGKAACHTDFRIAIEGKEQWIGFETGSFSLDKENPVKSLSGNKLLVPAFKNKSGDFSWLDKVGVGEATEWVGSRGTPTRLFQIEDCKIEFGKVEEHVIVFKLFDTKRVKSGWYTLMAAPLGGKGRTWLLTFKG